ncbi:Phosphatidate cytidylyltransferase [Segatella buccae]|uniref:Phosphatidate cytidylyltransferase n=1 Tax=Segatella buccae TaxID=28126 RepID=A0AAQ1UIG1_9BACT|nr:phosphatidate cytidylyltransferase [Segatella buccae]SUB79674.1 Phosphatidate cytidylyltransferase [Segatella buccae]
MSEKVKNLIIRAITGAVFVAIMVVGISFRPDVMILLFAAITGLTIWEFTGLVNQSENVAVNRFISTAAGIYFFLAVAGYCSGLTPSAAFVPYLLTVVYLLVSELYLKQTNPINNWAYTMLSQMYIALPFSMINVLAFRSTPDGNVTFEWLLPLSLFIFLWTNDTGAYCSGSLLGRHKLFPRISPGKSWEGSIGGAAFVMIAAAIIYFLNVGQTDGLVAGMPLWQWLGLGLVVVVFGTWGDLVESLFKRTLGIKDSGNILPGHGGMLDRFDSSLMAIPAAVVYLYTLQLFA